MTRTRILLLTDAANSPLHRIAVQFCRACTKFPTVDVEICTYAAFLDGDRSEDQRVDVIVCLWYGQAYRVFDAMPAHTRRVLCVYESGRWALGSRYALHANRAHLYRGLQRADIVIVPNHEMYYDIKRFMCTPPPIPSRAPWRRCDGMRKMHRLPFDPLRTFVCYDGVDLQHFVPQPWPMRPLRHCKRRLRVGWAGNRAMHGKAKGVDLIEAVCEANRSWLKLCTQDSSVTQRAHESMVDFYASIDVYVCMSASEGTPNTILETVACARPFVSTHVGIARSVCIHARALGFEMSPGLLCERTTASLCEALRALYESPRQRLVDMGAVGRATLERVDWDWSYCADHLVRCAIFSSLLV